MVKAVSDSPSVHSQSVSLSPRDSKILDTGHLKVFWGSMMPVTSVSVCLYHYSPDRQIAFSQMCHSFQWLIQFQACSCLLGVGI